MGIRKDTVQDWGIQMDKPIWVICKNDDLAAQFESFIKHLARRLSPCPPMKTICGKHYKNGCFDCWQEWIEQNVEFVKDGEQE